MATLYGTCPVAPGYWGPTGKLASFPWLLPLPSQTPGCDAAQRIEKSAETRGWGCILENWVKAMVFSLLLTVNGPYCAHFFSIETKTRCKFQHNRTCTSTFYMFQRWTINMIWIWRRLAVSWYYLSTLGDIRKGFFSPKLYLTHSLRHKVRVKQLFYQHTCNCTARWRGCNRVLVLISPEYHTWPHIAINPHVFSTSCNFRKVAARKNYKPHANTLVRWLHTFCPSYKSPYVAGNIQVLELRGCCGLERSCRPRGMLLTKGCFSIC